MARRRVYRALPVAVDTSAARTLRNAASKRQARKTPPDTWSKLVESEDELLMELLSDKLEDLCGAKPDPDAVASFLHKQPLVGNELVSAPSPNKQSALLGLAPPSTPQKPLRTICTASGDQREMLRRSLSQI